MPVKASVHLSCMPAWSAEGHLRLLSAMRTICMIYICDVLSDNIKFGLNIKDIAHPYYACQAEMLPNEEEKNPPQIPDKGGGKMYLDY